MATTDSESVLILGVTGQDGAYLAYELLKDGYQVHGTTRDISSSNTSNLAALGIADDITLHSVSITDFQSLLSCITLVKPTQIYHLAGLTSVAFSFQEPLEAVRSITLSTINLLEVVRFFDPDISVFIPTSSDCFGNISSQHTASETTLFNPRSPYAIAKASAFWIANNYRESYGLKVSIGVLSNHESPLRGRQFVTQKVISYISRVLQSGFSEQLELGDLTIIRDWGWAPEYVSAIKKINSSPTPDIYIVATGLSMTLSQLIDSLFKAAGLDDYRNYVTTTTTLARPNEIREAYLNPQKIRNHLGWTATIKGEQLAYELINQQLK